MLLVAAERYDDAAAEYAWEADGVPPATLRAALWWRAVAVAVPAVPAGILGGVALAALTARLVAVTATATAAPAAAGRGCRPAAGHPARPRRPGSPRWPPPPALAAASLREPLPAAAPGCRVTARRVDRRRPVVDVRDAFCLHALPDGAVVALRGITLTIGAGGAGRRPRPQRLGQDHAAAAARRRAGARRRPGGGRGPRGRGRRAGGDAAAAALAGRAARAGSTSTPARTLRPELDVLDNVALQLRLGGTGAGAARAAAAEALDAVGAGHLAGRDVVALSGGEAQRVAVAAALAHRPVLVLADEPSGELDAVYADLVYDALVGRRARRPAPRSCWSATTGGPPGSPTGSSASATAGSARPGSRAARSCSSSTTAAGCGCPSRCGPRRGAVRAVRAGDGVTLAAGAPPGRPRLAAAGAGRGLRRAAAAGTGPSRSPRSRP